MHSANRIVLTNHFTFGLSKANAWCNANYERRRRDQKNFEVLKLHTTKNTLKYPPSSSDTLFFAKHLPTLCSYKLPSRIFENW